MKSRIISKKNFCSLCIFISLIIAVAFSCYLLQKYYAHKNLPFTPEYERVELTIDSDYDTIFLQTGLGKPAVEKIMAENDFDSILKAQEIFFTVPETECVPMFGWFTREDRLGDSDSIPFADLRTGDILVTLSTHSMGWRHGHAGFVIDKDKVLECQRMGEKSSYEGIYFWSNYTNYAVLRVKDLDKKMQRDALSIAESVKGTPYNVFSGIISSKVPDSESNSFGFYCTNLIWYIWEQLGIDIDSDGGRIVSAKDILYSDELEVVQIFGMDPREFL